MQRMHSENRQGSKDGESDRNVEDQSDQDRFDSQLFFLEVGWILDAFLIRTWEKNENQKGETQGR